MRMSYKEDWPAARERLEAWWDGEILDRVVIQITAPKAGWEDRGTEPVVEAGHGSFALPVPETNDALPGEGFDRLEQSTEASWLDAEGRVKGFGRQVGKTVFGGETYPRLCPFFSSDSLAAYLGSRCRFPPQRLPDSIWFLDIIEDWDPPPPLALDPNNKWWQATQEMTRLAVEDGAGKYYVGHTDIGGVGDVLAHLRGPQNLCLDLVDHPDEVKEAECRIDKLWFQVYEEQLKMLWPQMEGTDGWLGAWGPGKTYPIQCDFSAYLSPEMFEEFFLPHIRAQAEWLDNAVYHLDGPDAIRHLDLLLDIPEIKAIQWVPGAGAPPQTQWISLHQRVQAAGKGLVLGVEQWEVEPLLRELSPEGLLLQTHCDSEEEARRLVESVIKWTHQYHPARQ
jgi:hypothetical protein